MDMMPTGQDPFKRAPISSASLTAASNMLTPLQPPKVPLYVTMHTL